MRVEAKNFHPMRGHVDANVRIDFKNGATLFVQPCGNGWALYNAFGDRVSDPGLGAMELTALVVRMDDPEAA